MAVPFLDLRAQVAPIRDELLAAAARIIDSARFILGPEVEALERELAEHLGVPHAVGVSSGSDALLVSLMALGIGPGDAVVTTPYSFFATAGAIARLGATPVFADIDPETCNLCPRALAERLGALDPAAGRPRAIIPVHLFGQCAEMDPILELASEHGLDVVEDAAQAIGATYPSARGTLAAGAMGRLGCFSFFPTKNLGGLGDGGLVTTADDALADRIRLLRNHGARPKYHHAVVGGNFRLDALHAATLRVKLPHLARWHAMRRANAAHYDAHLDHPAVTRPHAKWGAEHHVYNQYVIRVAARRDALREFLAARGIGTEVYYPVPFHEQACFAHLGQRPGDFPHAEHAARHTLALPIYPGLEPGQIDEVIEAIGAFYG